MWVVIALFAGVFALAMYGFVTGTTTGGDAVRDVTTRVRQAASFAADAAPDITTRPERKGPPALNGVLAEHLDELRQQNLLASDQGVLIETMDGDRLVAHNEERLYNPASVLKLATALAVLEKYPAEHRFRTVFVVEGLIVDGVVDGNLGIRSDGDPTLDSKALQQAVTALKEKGLKRVSGDLVVAGPFSYRSYDETPKAIDRFQSALERGGISIDGTARQASAVDGIEIVALVSEPLGEIVQRMNAHSINWIADNMATTVGGPRGITSLLVERNAIPRETLDIRNGSGLDENSMTAAGIVEVVRALVSTAERRGLSADRVIPAAGIDSSTMRARFTEDEWRGSVIAKTGTQSNVDGGVATLAGVAYTRDRGPVVFAILNSHGDVHNYRRWEDRLLRSVVEESGGPEPIARAENTVPEPLAHDVERLGAARVTTGGEASR